jgi:hypothetical protein
MKAYAIRRKSDGLYYSGKQAWGDDRNHWSANGACTFQFLAGARTKARFIEHDVEIVEFDMVVVAVHSRKKEK